MIALHALQQQLADYLQAPASDGSAALEAQLVAGPGASRGDRLRTYRQLVRTAHADALRSTYPACCEVVGLPYFRQVASHHFATRPTAESNLDLYGHDFADTWEGLIAERDELAGLRFLPDLVRLEWAWHAAAAEPTAFVAEEPVHLLWDALVEGRDPPDFLGGGSVEIVVWRDGDERRIRATRG